MVLSLYNLPVSRCAAHYTSKYKSVYIMDDDRLSVQKLEFFDCGELKAVEISQVNWIDEVKRTLKLKDFSKATVATFMPPKKETICRWALEAVDVITSQNEVITQLKDIVEAFKTDALVDKAKIVKLQDKLLENKDEQIKTLESVVEKTVHSTVEREIKSYSEAVSKSSTDQGQGPVVTPEHLKLAVKNAMKEEDRSRNVIVFGLREDEGEQVEKKVSELFADLGEKPRIQASRIGRKSTGGTVNRPVKVVLSNSTAAHQILLKAKLLKQIEVRKTVFISPDRSVDEREHRRNLVTELKKLITEQPNRHHFIRAGKVQSLVVQFVAESRFANCEFANLFFDFDESQFSRFQKFSQFITKIIET